MRFDCPSCGTVLVDGDDLKNVTSTTPLSCARCGAQLQAREALKENEVSAPAIVRQPKASRIERRQVYASKVAFYVPRGERGWGLLFTSVFFFLILIPVGLRWRDSFDAEGLFLSCGCTALMLAAGYGGLRLRFAKHLLFVDEQRVTLRRTLLGRTVELSVETSKITSVKLVEAYELSENQPVFGVEVRAADEEILFGSGFSDEDKAWLVLELQQVLKPLAPNLELQG